MAREPSESKKEKARRQMGERITEKTGEGLLITRLDGSVERVGKGGKLELVSGPTKSAG
jgi:hypothetical protein